MYLLFYGAVREVTGSMHLLETDSDKILLDCGMFQGRREESDRKNRQLPFDPSIISNVVLSHAHIDHSGRIPLLAARGFAGQVFSTRATAHACEYMLPDSARIQESDASYLNYKRAVNVISDLSGISREEIKKRMKKNGRSDEQAIAGFMKRYDIGPIKPLYSSEDAEYALTLFSGMPYNEEFTIGKDITCTFYEAGHILGSAITVIKAKQNGKTATICYTGDLGRYDKPIIKNPAKDFSQSGPDIDLLILESTYGNRTHEPVGDMAPRLKKIINETVARGGTLLIPAFAFGRTQELLYTIHELYNNGGAPKIPVYVDSPLATRITKVFGEHPEVYDKETHKVFLENGMNPFMFPQLQFIDSVQESMALMREEKPHIVISAAGMCEAGRILHHLRYKIHNPNNTILIVGYMAQHTLGRRLLEKGGEYRDSGRQGNPPTVNFMGKEYPLKAHVENMDGFSAHADKDEMLRFLKNSKLNIKKIALVHGEEDQMTAFAQTLKENGYSVFVPKLGDSLKIK
jgi:metallo-beta-lactamase family protein